MAQEDDDREINIGNTWTMVNQQFADEVGVELRDIPTAAAKRTYLNVSYNWLETRIDPDWIAAFRLLPQDGVLQIAELRIFPAERYRWRVAGEWSASLLGNKAPFPTGGLKMAILQKIRTGAPWRHSVTSQRAMIDPASRFGAIRTAQQDLHHAPTVASRGAPAAGGSGS